MYDPKYILAQLILNENNCCFIKSFIQTSDHKQCSTKQVVYSANHNFNDTISQQNPHRLQRT